MENSYFTIGYDDYLYAKDTFPICKRSKNYNSVVGILAQAAEKILKEVIEVKFVDDSSCVTILKTYNLRTIVNKIKERYPDCGLDSFECKWLGDIYFDARYPGDNFVKVNEEDAEKALEITEEIIDVVKQLLDM